MQKLAQSIVLLLSLILFLAGCASSRENLLLKFSEPQPIDALSYDTSAIDPISAPTISPTVAEAPDPEPRYPLTDEDRLIIEQIVMNEARGEPYEGQMMIAQCILDGMERNSLDLTGYMKAYGTVAYTDEEPYDGVKEAVSAVFDDGERVTDEKADLWYAYKNTKSIWHENQQYITTVCCHKFFWCNRDVA